MEKTKTKKNSVDLKTSSYNLFLNISLFFLGAIIIFMVYSLYVKITATDSEIPIQENTQVASDIIQADVLNGCGVGGIADRFTDFLRNNKVDVVYSGNYIRFDMDETLVIDRTGNKANALKVAEILGVSKSNVIQQLNKEYLLDVSIVIGRDYYNLLPLK
ncbi:MAG: LytR family transcriptional regulator [Ignavibacteria bacterium]|nr:LytR family transcriptional regulator [Ignavibacteria bacterium]